MKAFEFLHRAKSDLQSVSDTPQLDAELILSEVLQKPKEFFYAYPDSLLSASQKQKAGVLLQQRLLYKPMAQIRGRKEFYGLDFFVNEHVLVPRPETELLVEKTIPLLKNGGTLVDIGTGSGSIALSLAKYSHVDEILAGDISPFALQIAKKNAEKHDVSNIRFFLSDLFQNIPKNWNSSPVIVVANLPYVPHAERHKSTQHEPDIALYSGADGLSHYRRFFPELRNFPCDVCLFEFHPPQRKYLEVFISSLFPKAKGEFFCDYAGLYRFGMISMDFERKIGQYPT